MMACLKFSQYQCQPVAANIDAIDERQPAEIDAEDQDQQQSREERRQRKADEGKRVGDLVEDRIGPHRGIDADRQRDRQCQDLRRADHEQRGRDALQDQAGRRRCGWRTKSPSRRAASRRASAGSERKWDRRSRISPASAARTSGGILVLAASSPNGSPGASASSTKRMRLMPSRLGRAMTRRLRMYFPIVVPRRPFRFFASQASWSHASRYQLASCHRSLSQPLRCAVKLPLRAVTLGRRTQGLDIIVADDHVVELDVHRRPLHRVELMFGLTVNLVIFLACASGRHCAPATCSPWSPPATTGTGS